MKENSQIFTIPKLAEISPYLNNDARNLLVEKKVWDDYFPLHRHEYLELELVLKGAGKEFINGQEFPLEPGMFYLLRPSDFHEIVLTEQLEVITISFDLPLLPPLFHTQFLSIDKNYICYAKNTDMDYLTILFETFNKEYLHNEDLRELHLQNLLSCILVVLTRLTSTTPIFTDFSNPIMPALNYMSLHFTENPSLHEIAEIVHLNSSYFSTAFKKHTGKSYIDYLTELKISYAKKLLTTNQLSIIQIASASGFNSINNFSRAFKKVVGMSPTEYKNSLTINN